MSEPLRFSAKIFIPSGELRVPDIDQIFAKAEA